MRPSFFVNILSGVFRVTKPEAYVNVTLMKQKLIVLKNWCNPYLSE